jgi:hypothetical protein
MAVMPELRAVFEVPAHGLGLIGLLDLVGGLFGVVRGLFGLVGQMVGQFGPAAGPLGGGAGLLGPALGPGDLLLVPIQTSG